MSIEDFHKLMRLLEERLNSDTQKRNSLYKDCEGQKLESVLTINCKSQKNNGSLKLSQSLCYKIA